MLFYKGHEPLEAVVRDGLIFMKDGIELTVTDLRKHMAEIESASHNDSVQKDFEATLSHSEHELQQEGKRENIENVQLSKLGLVRGAIKFNL